MLQFDRVSLTPESEELRQQVRQFLTETRDHFPKPNSDFAGIVKDFGERKTTSLSTVIISFLIYTGFNSGFSKVTSLCMFSLTKLDSSIGAIESAGVTAKFILNEMNS